MPYSRDSAMTFVDYRDVAEAAAIAFTTDDLVNGTFELAAGGMVTRSELAALMTRYAGRQVAAQDGDPPSPCAACPMRPRGTACSQCSPTTPPTGSTAATAWLSALGRTPRSLNDFFAELAR